MDGEKLNKEGLKKVWLKFWSLLKVIVGDVDVEGKGDLQTQINDIDQKVEECFQSASDGKKLVADAITGKGVLTAASDTFATMAGNISVIETGTDTSDASAVASNILEGRTAYVKDGRVTGTMTNEGAWTGETTGNSNVLIPEGYHNGRGYVSGSGAYNKGMSDADARANADSRNYKTGYDAGVAATKKGNAGAGDVLSGKTFTNASSVNEKGTMANKGGTTVDAGGVTQDDTYTYLTVPAAGYYNTNSKLRTANSNLQADLSQLSAAGTWGGGYAAFNGYATSASIPAGSASYVLVYVSLSQYPENNTYISVTNLAELPAFTITNRGYPGVKIFEVVDTTESASVTARSGGDYGSASVTIRALK